MKTLNKLIEFLSSFIEDFFIALGIYFITKAGFLIYKPLGFALLGFFSLWIGISMMTKKIKA